MKSILPFLTLTICILILSCKKDFLEKNSNDQSGQQVNGIQISQPLTIANAKDCFYSSRRSVANRSDTLYSDSIILMMTYIKPLWNFADTIMYKGNIPVLAIPIEQCTANFPEREMFLVFFTSTNGQITYRLVIIKNAPGYNWSTTYFQNFTGDIIQIDPSNHLVNSLRFQNGLISGKIQRGGTVSDRDEVIFACTDIMMTFDLPGCYPMTVMVEHCVPVGGNSSSGSGSGTGSSNGGGPYGDDPLGWSSTYTSGTNTGGGTNNPNSITNYFNLDDFEGLDRKNAAEINQFKNQYGLITSSPALLASIIDLCNLSTDPEELFSELKEVLHSGIVNMPQCIKDVIIQDRIDFLHSKGLDITEQQLQDVIDNDCLFSSDFANCSAKQVTLVEGSASNPIINSKTCKSSFKYIPVGNGYTAQVNNVKHSYGDLLGFGFVQYTIGVMCIQVRGEDANNVPLTADKAAELSAYAMDNARIKVYQDLESEVISTGEQARQSFKEFFVNALSDLTGGKATSSVSYGSCSGNIPEHNYEMDLFHLGFCEGIW